MVIKFVIIVTGSLLLCGTTHAQTPTVPAVTTGQSIKPSDFAPMSASKADVANGTLTNPTITGGTLAGVAGVVGYAASNAALKTMVPPSFGQSVARGGFATLGDGGAATFTYSSSACSLNSGAGDNGAQVAPTTGGGCWLLQPSALTDIRVWGAKADDATDIGPFIQAAYNANVGCVSIPAGIWRQASGVTFSAQPHCFPGMGWNEAVLGGPKLGTWIHITSTAFTPVTITGQTGQGGTGGFSQMAFYQDQPAPGSGWAPSAYPAIFKVTNNPGRVDFSHLMFYNTTRCIEVYGSGRIQIDDIKGQPVGTCIQIDQARDVMRISHVEFWPFWSGDANVHAYQQANVDPILMLRADTPRIDDIFGFSYHSTIAFGTSTNLIVGDTEAVTTGAQLTAIQSDATKYGLWIKPGTTGVQLQIDSLRGAGQAFPGTGSISGSETYRDEGTSTTVSIGNFDCYYAGASCAQVTGNGLLQIANPVLWNFNNDNVGASGMDAGTSGNLFIANQPSIANLSHGGGAIPFTSAEGMYAVRGVRQYWTPTVRGTSTAGSGTYGTQLGTFWYDGSKLDLTFNISMTGVSGMTGSLAITGLPRAINGLAGQLMYCSIASFAGLTFTTGFTTVSGLVDPSGAQQILMLISGNGQNTTTLPASAGGTGFVLQGSCTTSAGQ